MARLQRILLISDTFFLLSGALLSPIYALFVAKIGGDLLDASITSALFMFTAGIVIYILAQWEDKQRHLTKFVVIGYGLTVIGMIGYLFVSTPMTLFVVQAILGLAVACKDPAYDALFSESSGKHLARAWGEWESMDYMVLGVGAIMGGVVAERFGFSTLFVMMAIFSIVAFIISLVLLKQRRET